jgi:cell wall-associated NlpC family hydrolase
MVVLFAAWTGSPLLAVTKSQEKKTAKSSASSKKTASADKETSSKKSTPAKDEDDEDEQPAVMTPAAVSTISIEDISGFDKYPRQIQSLVQSSLALTHLELGYLYGSHEPSKGGMDCSGTIYHVLHFQGLKDVPRQSDEMCQWVEKKTQLHLTPTATSFDSEEFKDLKPGNLLFWTNTTATTRKLPVTHVMVYLGKLKKNGKRIVFGSSDGRAFQGNRRSGVSVFDFSLPRAESPSRFYGYGQAPGLLPFVAEPPVIAETSSAPKESVAAKEAPVPKESLTAKAPLVTKESPAPKEVPVSKTTPAPKETAVAKAPSEPKEEVRKAVTAATDSTSPSEAKKTAVVDAAPKSKAPTTAKPKASATKKKSSTVSSTRRRTPPAPPKSAFQQKVDQTVSSVRRFFQQ